MKLALKQFFLDHSDAIRVLSKFIIPIIIALIVVIIVIVYTIVRQKANKPLESSNCKSKFASAYSGMSAAVSNDPVRQSAGNMSASNATRRMNPSQIAPPPQQTYSRGTLRQHSRAVPREQAKPTVRTDEDGVLEFCLEYMEDYRI